MKNKISNFIGACIITGLTSTSIMAQDAYIQLESGTSTGTVGEVLYDLSGFEGQKGLVFKPGSTHHFKFAAGYEVKQNIAVELGFAWYEIRPQYQSTTFYNTSGSNNIRITASGLMQGHSFRITPSVTFTHDFDHITAFFKAGFMGGISNIFIDKESQATDLTGNIGNDRYYGSGCGSISAIWGRQFATGLRLKLTERWLITAAVLYDQAKIYAPNMKGGTSNDLRNETGPKYDISHNGIGTQIGIMKRF